MRDIDILLRVDDHERAALGAKLLQHGSHRFVGPIAAAAARGHRDELGQLCGSAHVAVLGVALGQSLKDEPCHVAVVIGGQPRMDFLGMAIEGVMNGFDRRVLVVREIDRPLVRARLARHFPHAHQGVLNHWQLIVIVLVGRSAETDPAGDGVDVVEQPLHQPGCDASAADGHGAFDRFAELLPRHARHQELTVVQRLGKSGETRAVTQVVRAHRQDDVDRHVVLSGRGKEKVDAFDRFFPRSRPGAETAIAEDLFELIGQHEQALMRIAEQQLRRMDEAEAAISKPVDDSVSVGSRRCLLGIEKQAVGQVGNWISAGPERRDLP